MSDGRESVPALVVEASGTPGGVAAVVDRIEEACRAGGRFGVLIDARAASGDMAAQDRRALVARLRGLRGELKERCVGVAFLTGAGEQGRRLRAAGLLFGCPVHASGSLDATREWLAAQGASTPAGPHPTDRPAGDHP